MLFITNLEEASQANGAMRLEKKDTGANPIKVMLTEFPFKCEHTLGTISKSQLFILKIYPIKAV